MQAAAAEVQTRTGATFIHPSNDFNVMSGQGTLALELLTQVSILARAEPPFDAIIVPLGGK